MIRAIITWSATGDTAEIHVPDVDGLARLLLRLGGALSEAAEVPAPAKPNGATESGGRPLLAAPKPAPTPTPTLATVPVHPETGRPVGGLAGDVYALIAGTSTAWPVQRLADRLGLEGARRKRVYDACYKLSALGLAERVSTGLYRATGGEG